VLGFELAQLADQSVVLGVAISGESSEK